MLILICVRQHGWRSWLLQLPLMGKLSVLVIQGTLSVKTLKQHTPANSITHAVSTVFSHTLCRLLWNTDPVIWFTLFIETGSDSSGRDCEGTGYISTSLCRCGIFWKDVWCIMVQNDVAPGTYYHVELHHRRCW